MDANITALIVAIIGAAVSFYTATRQRKLEQATRDKTKAEADKTQAEASEIYERLASKQAEKVTALEAKVSILQEQLEYVNAEMDTWARGIEILVNQICELNHVPRWRPEPRKPKTAIQPRPM